MKTRASGLGRIKLSAPYGQQICQFLSRAAFSRPILRKIAAICPSSDWPASLARAETAKQRRFDARPLLAKGEEPLGAIMRQAAKVRKGGVLVLDVAATVAAGDEAGLFLEVAATSGD